MNTSSLQSDKDKIDKAVQLITWSVALGANSSPQPHPYPAPGEGKIEKDIFLKGSWRNKGYV